MHKTLKRGINGSNTFLKKSRKFISVLAVFLLISTLFSSIVSADNIFTSDENTEESESIVDKISNKIDSIKERLLELKETLRDRLSRFKDRLSNLLGRPTVEEQDDTVTEEGLPLKTSITNLMNAFVEIKDSPSTLMFHTNYNGIEKNSQLKLLGGVEINVDDDPENKPDIAVKLRLYPYLEPPLRLSINFKLIIEKLPDFPDDYALFQGYMDIYFPGLLSPSQKGDRIRFGYESEAGELVPDNCSVTYRYIPNILSIKRPEHKAEIDPGSSAGNAKLSLLLSYTNFDGDDLVSSVDSRIVYDKAVKSEVHIYGSGLLGESILNFERTVSEPSNIDLLCNFYKNQTNVIGYVYDLPEKVTFTLDWGLYGYAEFNTYGTPPSEIGIMPNASNVNNKLYFKDLPSIARLEWYHDLLIAKKANVSFYTDTAGVSFNGQFVTASGGELVFSISSNENLDCSAELDLLEGYFEINRSEVDLSISFSARAGESSFDLSFNLSRPYANPFGFYFDVGEEVSVTLANKSLEVTDFYLLADFSKLFFGIKADRVVKNHEGLATIIFNYTKDGDYAIFNLSILLEEDVSIEIYGLMIGLAGEWMKPDWADPGPFIITQDWSFKFSFKYFDFEYFVAEDWSWGYFNFRGSVSYEAYRLFTVNGAGGGFIGKIYAGSETDGLNISWYTDYTYETKGYNLTKLNVSGIIFGLENFHFYLGDIINITIADLEGSIEIKEACNESGVVSFEFIGEQGSFDANLSFAIFGFSGFNLSLFADDFHMDQTDTSVLFEVAWDDSSLTNIIFQADSNLNVSILNLDIELGLNSAPAFSIDNMTGYLQGLVGIDLNIALPLDLILSNETTSIDFWEDSFALVLEDTEVYLSIDNLNISMMESKMLGYPMDLGKVVVSMNASGETKLSFINFTLENEPFGDFDNITWVNLTFGIDAINGQLDVEIFEIGNIQGILDIIFMLLLGLPAFWPETTLLIENLTIVGYSNLTLYIGLWAGFPLYLGVNFENTLGTTLYLEKGSLIFYDLFNDMEDIIEIFTGIKINLAEIIPEGLLENLTENPFTFYFSRNVSLSEGSFGIIFTLFISGFQGVKIPDGSALEYAEIGAEFPNLFDFYASFKGPIDSLDIQINNMDVPDYEEPYIFIDTKNTTLTLDIYMLASYELCNLLLDILNTTKNIEFQHLEHDLGFWFNDTVLKADELDIRWEGGNFSNHTIEGYIQIQSGELLVLVNGEWISLTTPSSDLFTFTFYPGYLQITFNMMVTDFPININPSIDGVEFFISGNVSVGANTVIEAWWNIVDGDFDYARLEFNINENTEVSTRVDDFELRLANYKSSVDCSWKSLSFDGNPSLVWLYIELENGELTAGGSAGVDIDISEFYFSLGAYHITDGIFDSGTHTSFVADFPILDVKLSAEAINIPLTGLLADITKMKIQGPDQVVIGDIINLTVKNAPEPENVIWYSEDPENATVNETGVVTGIKLGNAIIVAVSGDQTAEKVIEVVEEEEPTPKEFKLDPESATLLKGWTYVLTPTGDFEKPLTWESNDTSIVTVDENGNITASETNTGTSMITVTDNLGRIAYSNITVIDESEVEKREFFIGGSIIVDGSLNIYTDYFDKGSTAELTIEAESVILTDFEISMVTINGDLFELSIPEFEIDDLIITFSNGNLGITINSVVTNLGLDIDFSIGDIDLLFGCEITTERPNTVIDVMWEIVEGYIPYFEIMSISETNIRIDNFVLNLKTHPEGFKEGTDNYKDRIDVSWGTLALYGESDFNELQFIYEYGEVEFGVSADVTIEVLDFFADIEIYTIIDDPLGLGLGQVLPGVLPYLTSGTISSFIADIPVLEIKAEAIVIPLNFLVPMMITGDDSVVIGKTIDLNVIFVPDPENVIWYSEDPLNATVDKDGIVTGIALGYATIVAESGGQSVSKDITIRNESVTNFSIDPKYATLLKGSTYQLTPKGNFEKPLTWESNDTSIATVDEDGLVTASETNTGTAMITATDNKGRIAYSNISVIDKADAKRQSILVDGSLTFDGSLYVDVGSVVDGAVSIDLDVDLATISDFNIKAIDILGGFKEISIPNMLEVEDGSFSIIKENENSPSYITYSGNLSIVSEYDPSWGIELGAGIRVVNSSKETQFLFSIKKVDIGIGVEGSGGGMGDNDGGTINMVFDPDAGELNINSDDEISFNIENINIIWSFVNKITVDLISWNKLGSIDWTFDLDVEIPEENPNGKLEYIELNHYFDIQSKITIDEVNLTKYNRTSHEWEQQFLVDLLEFDRTAKGYSSFILDRRQDYLNLSHNINATINLSVDIILPNNKPLSIDINSRADCNWTLHVYGLDELESKLQAEWIIHEAGYCRELELIIAGGKLSVGLKLESIQLTAGKIILEFDYKDTKSLKIDNQGVYVSCEYLNFKLNGVKLISFVGLHLEPGVTYIEGEINPDENAYLSIDNTANIEFVVFEYGGFIFGREWVIYMKPGLFDFTWTNVSGQGDFDDEFTINNGVFESEFFVKKIKIGIYDIEFDWRDVDTSDYDNTITLKLRRGGPQNWVFWISTTDHIDVTRWTLTVYKNDLKILQFESIVNYAIRFDGCWIGYMEEGTFDMYLDIDVDIVLSFNFEFNLGFRNDNDEYQELGISGFKNPQQLATKFDATGLTEDLTIGPASIKFLNYEITSSITLNAQSYLDFEIDSNPVATPEEGENGLIYMYIDTGGESLAVISVEFYNPVTYRGFRINAEVLSADEFNISCPTHQIVPGGNWWPKLGELSYDLDLITGVSITIEITLPVYYPEWETIFDSENLVVFMEQQTYEVLQGQSLEFQVFVFGGTEPYTYTWFLPNGEQSEQQSSPLYSYTFETETLGNYEMGVAVVDRFGLTGTASANVIVVDQLSGNGAL